MTVDGVETERLEVPAGRLFLDLSGDRWSARVALRAVTLRPVGGGNGLSAESFVLAAALLRAAEPPDAGG